MLTPRMLVTHPTVWSQVVCESNKGDLGVLGSRTLFIDGAGGVVREEFIIDKSVINDIFFADEIHHSTGYFSQQWESEDFAGGAGGRRAGGVFALLGLAEGGRRNRRRRKKKKRRIEEGEEDGNFMLDDDDGNRGQTDSNDSDSEEDGFDLYGLASKRRPPPVLKGVRRPGE